MPGLSLAAVALLKNRMERFPRLWLRGGALARHDEVLGLIPALPKKKEQIALPSQSPLSGDLGQIFLSGSKSYKR